MSPSTSPTIEPPRASGLDWDQFEALWADQRMVLRPSAQAGPHPARTATEAERKRQASLDFLHALVTGTRQAADHGGEYEEPERQRS